MDSSLGHCTRPLKEMSALTLCNLVPHLLGMQSERLNRFREDIDVDIVEGEGSGKHHSEDNKKEDTMHSQENPEESTCESDWDDKVDNSQQGGLHDESKGRANTPWQPGSRPSCHPTDKHLCPHSSSWGNECESEGVEEGEKVTTQEDVTEGFLRVRISVRVMQMMKM